MYKTIGYIRCYDNKLIVEIDNEIANYYRKSIPKYIAQPNPQRYDTHITVIRDENVENIDKYNNKKILITYSPYIHTDGVYFWLNVDSVELENIRLELGLEKSSKLSRPPSGDECFHITIGNLK